MANVLTGSLDTIAPVTWPPTGMSDGYHDSFVAYDCDDNQVAKTLKRKLGASSAGQDLLDSRFNLAPLDRFDFAALDFTTFTTFTV